VLEQFTFACTSEAENGHGTPAQTPREGDDRPSQEQGLQELPDDGEARTPGLT